MPTLLRTPRASTRLPLPSGLKDTSSANLSRSKSQTLQLTPTFV